jgi:FdrA protein
MGEGVSQAIGTGGRDLSKEVGGKTFTTAVKALISDEETELIILMSKKCDEGVANRMIELSRESKKSVVTYFPGSETSITERTTRVYRAKNFEHIAASSVALVRGDRPPEPLTREIVAQEMERLIWSESNRYLAGQQFLRALFSGGSFADQARELFHGLIENLYSYPSYGETFRIENPLKSEGHCIIDMGDDFFTRGKLHPMMDPTLRIKRIGEEIADGTIRVLLLDVALGFGAHHDPCGRLSKVIRDGKSLFERKGGNLSVVVHLCGTDQDPQGYEDQKKKLETSGAIVMESSTRAALLAGLLASQGEKNRANQRFD